ncbi:hypothetical protein T06_3164 [Trichinella sp. T6]|nr:hypothetical protein T06_8472 [Trichinella sp. T6]KRX68515.1 hypothetical protein T06_14852 [Trichinella sp. T6]KRX74072.1 hypothetical protein T06_3164 [Trichinella sp. T6]
MRDRRFGKASMALQILEIRARAIIEQARVDCGLTSRLAAEELTTCSCFQARRASRFSRRNPSASNEACWLHCVRAYGRREVMSYGRELPPRHLRASPLRPRYGIDAGSVRKVTTWTTRADARSRHIDRSYDERSDQPSRAEDVTWLGGAGRGGKNLHDENR